MFGWGVYFSPGAKTHAKLNSDGLYLLTNNESPSQGVMVAM